MRVLLVLVLFLGSAAAAAPGKKPAKEAAAASPTPVQPTEIPADGTPSDASSLPPPVIEEKPVLPGSSDSQAGLLPPAAVEQVAPIIPAAAPGVAAGTVDAPDSPKAASPATSTTTAQSASSAISGALAPDAGPTGMPSSSSSAATTAPTPTTAPTTTVAPEVDVKAPAATMPVNAPATTANEPDGSKKKQDGVENPPQNASDQEFVKGELTHLGADPIASQRGKVLVYAGYNRIGQTDYALLYPQIGFHVGQLAVGLGVPLNFEIFSSAYPRDPAPGENHVLQFKHAGKLRKEDWDQASDWAQIVTYLTYGRKEDHLYIDVGQQHVSTIGHGALMRRYSGNIDVNVHHTGVQFDAYNEYAGFEMMTNDVVQWNIIGMLGFVKPLAFLHSGSTLLDSVSLGVSLAMDRKAPMSIAFAPEPPCPVVNACPLARVPQVNSDNELVASKGKVMLGGLDLEAKVIKTENIDLKPYIDFSRFLAADVDQAKLGGGFTMGALARINMGQHPRHALRLIAELRFLGEGYRPGYFDTFYEVDRVLMMGTGGIKSGSGQVPLTKIESTVGSARPPQRTGYYLEASYGIRDAVGLTLALEGQTKESGKNFVAHLEVPVISSLQFYGTVYLRGFQKFSSLVDFDKHAVAFAGLRFKPFPIMFINLKAYKSFSLDAFLGQDGPLGTLQYENVFGWAGDIGLGWEF